MCQGKAQRDTRSMLPIPAPESPAPIRVLIVDDRPRTRRALGALLAGHKGCKVVGEAADGLEALDSVERLRPDLVLLDVWMPRLDGVAATAAIKDRWPATRVVVHSLAEERRAEALAAGADAFVPKGMPPAA